MFCPEKIIKMNYSNNSNSRFVMFPAKRISYLCILSIVLVHLCVKNNPPVLPGVMIAMTIMVNVNQWVQCYKCSH